MPQFLPAWLSVSGLYEPVDSARTHKTLLIATAGAATAAAYLLYRWRLGRNLPPGPTGVPILGRLPWMDPTNSHLTMEKECQRYGDICSLYMGSRLFVVVNSYPLMKEMLEDPMFTGRPQWQIFKILTKGCGIVFIDGDLWSQHRRHSLRILRDFGFARAQTVDMIDDQLDHMVQTLDEAASSAEPLKTQSMFMVASSSIITQLVLGRHFDYSHPELKEVIALVQKNLEAGLTQVATLLFPAVDQLVGLIPMSSSLVRDLEHLHKFIRKEIFDREKVMADESAQPECLCDVYIQERRKAEKAGDMETFKEFQLVRICLEFYSAGTDTTARSMEWLLLYMTFYPDVQDRVQRELDEVVGQSRRPRMPDKTELHYTCAVIDECYRKVSLAATGLFHRAMQDTMFHGYSIPSDAVIIPLVYGIHHRADYWEKPHEFYPEHFLDSEGHYRSSVYLIPFLIGRRSCVGESLARMEIFLFFTAIMQRYRVRPAPESLARKEEILLGHFGTLRTPGDYRLMASQR